MVHERIQSVVEAELFILDVDWVECSVHAVRVKVVEDEHANVICLTKPGVPLALILTGRDDLSRD